MFDRLCPNDSWSSSPTNKSCWNKKYWIRISRFYWEFLGSSALNKTITNFFSNIKPVVGQEALPKAHWWFSPLCLFCFKIGSLNRIMNGILQSSLRYWTWVGSVLSRWGGYNAFETFSKISVGELWQVQHADLVCVDCWQPSLICSKSSCGGHFSQDMNNN